MDLALPVFSLGQGKDRGKRPEGTQCVHARFREKTDHISRMDTPWDLPVFSLGLFPWQGKDRNSSIVYFTMQGKDRISGKRPILSTCCVHMSFGKRPLRRTQHYNFRSFPLVREKTEGKDRQVHSVSMLDLGKRPIIFLGWTHHWTFRSFPLVFSLREKTGIPAQSILLIVGKRPHLREKTDFKHLLCSYYMSFGKRPQSRIQNYNFRRPEFPQHGIALTPKISLKISPTLKY